MAMTAAGRRAIAGKVAILLLALVLAACGGDDSDSVATGDTTSGGATDTSAAGPHDGTLGDEGSGGGASATLIVEGEVYTWTAEQMTVCEINGVFGPANADFGVPPSQGGDGPWFQFIDRGDGGINFSAVLEGAEYTGTGSGAADEIRSDGFSYTGEMGTGGEQVDVEPEVDC
ncbi:MAG: hypothetical protein DWP92_02415 [Armatimonadetes bacterium]|nr:MAG: hypothetical protein DWP92_02415 [Armatimonadota bacterium]